MRGEEVFLIWLRVNRKKWEKLVLVVGGAVYIGETKKLGMVRVVRKQF